MSSCSSAPIWRKSRVWMLVFAAMICIVERAGAQDAYSDEFDQKRDKVSQPDLQRIGFDDLPLSVRNQARREISDRPLLGVEKSLEAGRTVYHVMFEVEGTEAGVLMDARGKVLDRWHFQEGAGEEAERDTGLTPTMSDIRYGPHKRNVFDFWRADSDKPTPLLVCIHGGGFSGGDKRGFREDEDLISRMLESGISVAAINYRLTEGGRNPFPIPMLDGARAIQYLRFHASKFNLDTKRFAAMGGSAGGCMLMWLGFHPDLAKPADQDPVLRESSRVQVLAPIGGQSCLHLPTLKKWFGVKSLEVHPAYWPLFALEEGPVRMTDRFDTSTRAASPITYLTADDPPIYLRFGDENHPIAENTSPNVWVHHPVMGIKLQAAMQDLDLECHVEYPGCERISQYSSQIDFIIRKLKPEKNAP